MQGTVATTPSYSTRRTHACKLSTAPHPAARWRTSFGPGGQLCFGSASITVVSLARLDSLCRPTDEPAAAHRTEQAMRVSKARCELSEVAAVCYHYIAAAGGPDASHVAMVEQHNWKLVAALFSSDVNGQPILEDVCARTTVLSLCSYLACTRDNHATLPFPSGVIPCTNGVTGTCRCTAGAAGTGGPRAGCRGQ